MWVPNLVVALVVVVLGGLAAQAVYRIVRGTTAEAGFGNPELVAKIAKGAVWVFANVTAVNQIGIAVALVNTLFMEFIAAISIALGLAFGLGGKDTAAKVVSKWHAKSEDAQNKIERIATGDTPSKRG